MTTMLDDRKAAILRAVVEEYIETAQPVGSAHVARGTELGVSAATVRNEMAALERDGFLVHPHTSAGRVPTDKGYRFFVDHLAPDTASVPDAHRQRVTAFFTEAHGELEQMLHNTSRLLSDLTSYGALVVAPPREHATVLATHLVWLSTSTVLAIAVLANGDVQKATVDLEPGTSEAQVEAAGTQLAAHLNGRLVTADRPVAPAGDPAVDALVASAADALRQEPDTANGQVYVGGTARMVAMFDAIETVRRVLAIIEQQYMVVSLLREALHDERLGVAIGAEHGVASLADCSIVVAPYDFEGTRAGTIGVLGPTRMNYPQAIATVAMVSQRLGRHLSKDA